MVTCFRCDEPVSRVGPLASAIILLGWVLVSLPWRAGADPGCDPAASLEGEAGLVREVGAILGSRGFVLEATEKCPAVEAWLRHKDGLIVLECRDRFGREVVRRVAQVGEAASVIESWARPDANAEWMEGWTVESATPAVAAEPDPSGPELQAAWLASSLAGEVSFDERGVPWAGTTLRACMTFWRLCMGGEGRFRRDFEMGRSELAFLASVELLLRVGDWEVAPGLEAGVAGPQHGDSSRFSDDYEAGGWRARGGGGARLSYFLARSLALELRAAAELSPEAQTRLREFDDNPHGLPPVDSRFFFRMGAGLRVAIP